MKIGRLKKLLEKFPDDLEIGMFNFRSAPGFGIKMVFQSVRKLDPPSKSDPEKHRAVGIQFNRPKTIRTIDLHEEN